MRNLKFIVGFTLAGFFLSLICGFFSHSNFLRVFLQAMLFAVIFALLAIIISVLFEKFLNDGVSGNEGDIGVENNAVDVQSIPRKGSKVDFVIQDEELPVSESENQFFVGENRQLLNDSDIATVSHTVEAGVHEHLQNNANDGFVPLQKESFENLTETEAKSEREYNNNSGAGFSSLPSSENVKKDVVTGVESNTSENINSGFNTGTSRSDSKNGDIDILPDMSEVTFEKKDEDESEVDSPFVSSGVNTSSTRNFDGVDVKDASIMAKAISSILSGDA